MADDDETIEEGAEPGDTQESAEEAPAEAGELIPEASAKPKNDAFTLMLVLTFVAFLGGLLLAGNELHDYYDVQFFVFGKK